MRRSHRPRLHGPSISGADSPKRPPRKPDDDAAGLTGATTGGGALKPRSRSSSVSPAFVGKGKTKDTPRCQLHLGGPVAASRRCNPRGPARRARTNCERVIELRGVPRVSQLLLARHGCLWGITRDHRPAVPRSTASGVTRKGRGRVDDRGATVEPGAAQS